MTTTTNTAEKFSHVAKDLANLENGPIRLITLVDRIKNIQNIKLNFVELKENSTFYPDLGMGDVCDLSELWVDITYQRKLRLAKLVNLIDGLEGYDKSVAGTIDTIVRPKEGQSGRKFVWDGFRRGIMYGLCGGEKIRISQSRHPETYTKQECIKEEARLFKIRNADAEKMKAPEIFKAKVIYGDEIALDQFRILKKAKLDLEGLNPAGVTLGGFSFFDKSYLEAKYGSNGDLKEFEQSVVQSSEIIRSTWPEDEIMSLHVMLGLAYMLRVNNEYQDYYTEAYIKSSFKKWKTKDPKNERNQAEITDVRLHGKATPCIAYYVAKHILKDENGVLKTIKQSLKDKGIRKEGFEMLDEEEFYHAGF